MSLRAAVTINEVAWMGSTESANHEWIELYNSGSSVDMAGWSLTSSGGLQIHLEGVLPGNSYAVLERTSDESAVASAFLSYTGALKNTGETLYLYRSDGGLEDQVAGGSDWENIGGDNVNKATAQYTTNGWITASQTPGSMNEQKTDVSLIEESEQNTDSVNTQSAVKSTKAESLSLPGITLSLDVYAPTTAFVHQPISFVAEPSGVGDTIQESLSYKWNFGDAETIVGREVQHTFMYPGTYVVQVFGAYARQHAIARHEITVLPMALSLSTNRDGDVQINNDSPYEVDVSKFRLVANEEIELPPYSALLAGHTITIPAEKIQYKGTEMIGLYDQMGALHASIIPKSSIQKPQPSKPQVNSVQRQSFQFVAEHNDTKEESVESDHVESEDINTVDQNEEFEQHDPIRDWSFGVMIVLLVIAIIAILLKPIPKRDSLDAV